MEAILLVTVLTLSLMAVDSDRLHPSNEPAHPSNTSTPTIPNSTATSSSPSCPKTCFCPTPTTAQRPPPPPPQVGILTVQWGGKARPCEGAVFLSLPPSQSVPLCHSSIHPLDGKKTCEARLCGPFLKWESIESSLGYLINSNGTVTNSTSKCQTLKIHCKDLSKELSQQLVGYKVVLWLLCVLLLALLLFKFGRPTYTAIRNRLSQKRQNQWIGPTQSQSVSYHRGQAGANPNNNTVKRQSYPGLERLTVNASREPSSNRNSDYDSYNS